MPKKKPTDDEVVLYITSKDREAEQAARPRLRAFQELWQAYQNKQDYSSKEGWQSQCFIPKLFMTIERASALVEKALFEIPKLFKMKIPADVQKTDELEAKRDADEKALKRALEKSNFTDIYAEATKCGFILGISAIKRLWEDGLFFENTDVMNLRIDPNTKPFQVPSYMIERKEMDLATLRKIAKKTNKAAGKQIFKMAEIDKLAAQRASAEDKVKARLSKGLGHYTPSQKRVEIWEFWGDIIVEHDNGKDTILEDQLVVIAEKNRIIRWQDNPFDDLRPPYRLTTPIVYPHRGIAGISMIEPVIRLQYTMNNLFNLAVDNMNFTVNKVFEVNPNILFDAHSINRIFPGKVIKSRRVGEGIEQMKVTPLTPETFRAIDMMSQQIEQGTAITEFLDPKSASRKTTAKEIEIKTAESHTMIDVIARRLEENSIKPLLEDCWGLMKQFGGFTGEYEFKVGGLSLLQQKEQKDAVMQVLAMAGQAPQLLQMTDIPELWQKLLSLLGLSEIYKEPQQQMGMRVPEKDEIQQRAERDAKKAVSQMSPQQIFSATQSGKGGQQKPQLKGAA